ncbi:MAG: DoxX family protein [Pseudomonadota bacterium]
MHDKGITTAPQTSSGRNGHTLLRMLIGSYFIAVALGLIPGTDFTILFQTVTGLREAVMLSSLLIFALSYMVIIGLQTRVAALLLSLITFLSAFVSFTGSGGDLADFWRDLALIAALMLTYSAAPVETISLRTKRRLRPRKSGAPDAPSPRATDQTPVASPRLQAAPRMQNRPTDLRAPLGSDEIENIFLDYAEPR